MQLLYNIFIVYNLFKIFSRLVNKKKLRIYKFNRFIIHIVDYNIIYKFILSLTRSFL